MVSYKALNTVFEHFAKASSLILVTEFGIVIDVKLLQL